MNGNTMRAFGAQLPRILTAITVVLLLCTACDDPPPSDSSDVLPALAMPADPAFACGPVNTANPLEHVGLRHNACVHSVILAAEPWDTLSMPTMFSRIQKAIPAWGEEAIGIPLERGIAHVKTAFALRIDSTARRQLAEFASPGCSPREIAYLRRIGRALCEMTSFRALEAGLLAIEKDILSESWPKGDSTEMAARVAISVAKHSCAYWKNVFCISAGIDPSTIDDVSSFRKSTELLIHLTSRTEIVTAADVVAAVSAAEAAAVFGPLAQLEAAVVSGGAVSIVVATLVYFQEIKGFLQSLCPWSDHK